MRRDLPLQLALDLTGPVALSYSGGASSEWLVEAYIRGVLPRPRFFAVFFADTGDEHVWTYDAVAEVEARCKTAGITFVRCSHPRGRLGDHLLVSIRTGKKRMDHPPFWIAKGGGRGRASQRCTREFKSAVLRRAQAAWLKSLGLRKRITTWIGFSADEKHRAQKALARRDVKWERLEFPAIRMGKTRAQQRSELEAWTGRAPKFSMCVCCPFKTPDRWAATLGSDRDRAIQIDEAIRNLDEFGLTDGEAFLSDTLTPVASLPDVATTATSEPSESCDAGRCFL